jgi:hypothetical protein
MTSRIRMGAAAVLAVLVALLLVGLDVRPGWAESTDSHARAHESPPPAVELLDLAGVEGGAGNVTLGGAQRVLTFHAVPDQGNSTISADADAPDSAPRFPWEIGIWSLLAMAPPLTRDRDTIKRGDQTLPYLVGAGKVIHAGALVVLDAGYAEGGKVGAALKAVGRANESVDNTGGAAGAKTVTVERGTFRWDNDGTNPVTQAHVGALAYIVDDHTVSSSHATNTRSAAGIIRGVEAAGVWVETI